MILQNGTVKNEELLLKIHNKNDIKGSWKILEMIQNNFINLFSSKN